MNYEFDFIGVNEDSSKDALAICFRFYSEKANRYIVGVYDGGFKAHGEAMVDLLNKYYFADTDAPVIDFVVCSHGDNDHASGLTEIFDNFTVSNLIMNRPWIYAAELIRYKEYGQMTVQSLEKKLREKYPYLVTLEEKATEQKTKIHEGFQGGLNIYETFQIFSPTKEAFLNLIVESNKTPLSLDAINESFVAKTLRAVMKWVKSVWGTDSIREGEVTSAENETSIILYGDMGSDGKVLLTGDAGTQGLTMAADYADEQSIDLHEVIFHQIPHHGGRHNVSPKIMNRIVGSILPENTTPTKTAFVSVAEKSDKPRKMVVNAYIRRGVKVFEARESSKWHHRSTPERKEYSPAIEIPFSTQEESWD